MKHKRTLAAVLAMVMLFSLLPMGALAEENGEGLTAAEELPALLTEETAVETADGSDSECAEKPALEELWTSPVEEVPAEETAGPVEDPAEEAVSPVEDPAEELAPEDSAALPIEEYGENEDPAAGQDPSSTAPADPSETQGEAQAAEEEDAANPEDAENPEADDGLNIVSTAGLGNSLIHDIPPVSGGTIYMGGIKWRIIGKNNSAYLLISDAVLSGTMSWPDTKSYCGSTASPYSAAFSSLERDTVISTSKIDTAFDVFDRADLTNEKMFLLSAEEALTYFSSDADRKPAAESRPAAWWLRSLTIDDDSIAAVISADGTLDIAGVNTSGEYGARPVFQMDRQYIITESAAEGGKSSATAGSGIFGKFLDGSGGDRKLTLLDSSRSGLKAGADKTTVEAGSELCLTFEGGATGNGNYVSAMICGSDGTALFYASLSTGNPTGTWNMLIPEELKAGAYTLKVFNETQNGDRQTDYAGAPVSLSLTVQDPKPLYTVSVVAAPDEGGTVSGGGSYAEGTEVTLTATPDEGYRFSGWRVLSGDITVTGDNKFTVGTKNVEILAIFEPLLFTVTVSDDGHGSGSASVSAGPQGTDVLLTAYPDEGYRFKEWKVLSGGVEVKNNRFTIGTENVEVRADFEEEKGSFIDDLIDSVPPYYGGVYHFGTVAWHVFGAKDSRLLVYGVVSDLTDPEGAMGIIDSLIGDHFSPLEQSLIVPVTKTTDKKLDIGGEDGRGGSGWHYEPSNLSNQKVFMLSARETKAYFPTPDDRRQVNSSWWLRSSRKAHGDTIHGAIYDGLFCDDDIYVDPTINIYSCETLAVMEIDPSKIFFESADGGKPAPDTGFSAFPSCFDDRNITLLDSSRSGFIASNAGESIFVLEDAQNHTVQLSYSGAKSGQNEYVSAMLCASDGRTLYYASLTPDKSGSGTWDLILPDALSEGNYTLKVFSEYRNDKEHSESADYASPMTEIPLTVYVTHWQALQDQLSKGGEITLVRDYTASFSDTALIIPAEKTVTLNLNWHSIDRSLTAAAADGNVMTNNGTLTITGSGSLIGGFLDGSGGAIQNNGSLTIEGGSYTGNRAKEGGAVYNAEGAALNITGGSFTGNTVTAQGGAVVNCGTMTLSGGTISGNSASGDGGGIWNAGTLTVTGGTISGNSASGDGAGIFLSDTAGKLQVSGSPVITDNKGKDIFLGTNLKISIVDSLAESARIGIYRTWAPDDGTVVITEGFAGRGVPGNLVSDDSRYGIRSDPDSGEAVIRPVHRIRIQDNLEHGKIIPDMIEAGIGETVTLTAVPDEGYRLTDWRVLSGGVTIRNDCFTMGEADVEIGAVFEPVAAGLIGDLVPVDGGFIWVNGIRWRVIGKGADTELLFTDNVVLGTTNWQNAMDHAATAYNAFSDPEKAAVVPTTKKDSDYTYHGGDAGSISYAAADLNDQPLFMLSAEEAVTYRGSLYLQNSYWRRSKSGWRGGVVRDDGTLSLEADYANYLSSRYAFQLNPASILLESEAVYGKPAADSGFMAYTVPTVETDRKLTLTDSTRDSFTADVDKNKAYPGADLVLSYGGAKTGEHEYVSAILCDSEGKILYYASLTPGDTGEGIWELTLPDGLSPGRYTLKIFSEQQNGDNQTDYAGPVKEFELVLTAPPTPDVIALDREYLLLSPEETAKLNVVNAEKTWTIEWGSSDKSIVTVTPWKNSAEIKAVNKGTAYITASVTKDGKTYIARCRVDVAEDIRAELTDITIANPKVTVELLRTDYTRLMVVPNLAQNRPQSTGNPDEPESGPVGAIRDARFSSGDAGTYFNLLVADDRTVEIMPKAEYVENPNSVKLKGTSGIEVYLDGSWQAVETPVTIKVKKTQPKVTVKAVQIRPVLNSNLQLTVPVAFTGARVLSAMPNEIPDWLRLEEEDGGFLMRYTGDTAISKTQSATVPLILSLEGWAVQPVVNVKVTVAPVTAKITFKPSALTLNAVSGETVTAAYTIKPAADIPIDGIIVTENGEESHALVCRAENGVLTVTAAPDFDAKSARRFKVILKACGKEYPVTVKTPAAEKSAVSLSVKAEGVIDSGIPNSAITLTVTPKGFHTGSGESYSFRVVRQEGKQEETPVKTFTSDSAVFTLSGEMLGGILEGNIYSVYTAMNYGEGKSTGEVNTKLTVKGTDPEKVKRQITLKAKGAIDLVRPETVIVVTPTLRNIYGYVPNPDDLIFFSGTGKKAKPLTDSPFDAQLSADGASFEITRKSGDAIDPAAKYSVGMKVTVNGQETETVTPVTLRVKMGAAKFTAAPATITLLKRDAYTSGTVVIATADSALSKIVSIESGTANYEVTPIGSVSNGKVAITYKGDFTKVKNTTVKLTVKLEGNGGSKVNATVSVKVVWA